MKQLQTVHATVDTQALTLSAPQSACPWEQRQPSGSRPSRRMRQDLYLTRSDPGTSRAVCAQTRPQPESSAYPVALIQKTDADYVIFVRSGPWLKVIKRENNQIIYEGALSGTSSCFYPVFWSSMFESSQDRLKKRLLQTGMFTRHE